MATTYPTLDVHLKEHWTEAERANVQLLAEFVETLMNAHDFELILDRFDGNAYIQHNRGIPDGIDGLVGYLRTLTKRYPEYSYDVKHMSVDGDLVTFHSHVTMKASDRGDEGKGFNIIDTWRVVDGKVGDHWDAIQPLSASMRLFVLLTGGKARNDNPVF